jgi:osmotically-inducible protein OsmY
MKTNTKLGEDILRELQWEPALDEANVKVSEDDGIVTLEGHVQSFWEKDAAVEAAQRVSGVRAVADHITVELPAASQRTDADIGRAVANALEWNAAVPDESLDVRVQDGWVTLSGEVAWQYQKAAAEHAVRPLVGVRGVISDITVKPRARASQVKEQIDAALRRYAELDAQRVRIETHNGTVRLHGAVRSWPEREQVERAAWAAPGVSRVINDIVVAPSTPA